MTNGEIAQIFFAIAEILELQGQNPFRVRAYNQGARVIEFHPEPLRVVYQKEGREGLLAIDGVGEALADKTIELLETGKLYYYEKLKEEIPGIILEIADIPGVGPKTAQKLYQAFQPKTVPELKRDLQKIVKEGGKGFQPKTIENLLRGIESLAEQGQRMTLTDAYPIAKLFIQRLSNLNEVFAIDMVGSLRRMRETVGDIDLIVAAKTAQPIIESFVTTEGVTDVLSQGSTKAMVTFNKKAHVDIEILPPAEYGSLLQHFTGSKEHNIAFRSLVDDLGLSFSEHGFKVLKPDHPLAKKTVTQAKKEKRWDETRQMILCPKEEQVYETVGLTWMPPELRENGGELQAAAKGTLPILIELRDIKGDIHVHSNRSGDGRDEPEVLIERAIELGYKYLGITDHTQGLGIAGKLSNKELVKHAQALRKLNEKYPEIQILPGCELNIMADGTLDVPDDILVELDVVVASVHSAFAQDRVKMTDRILRTLDNPYVDILAHPRTRILNYRGPINADWSTIYERAAQTKTALEINAYPERLDLDGVAVRTAQKAGCQFVISTDSHQADQLENMRYGLAMARRGWCEKSDVLNTMTLAQFQKWLDRK